MIPWPGVILLAVCAALLLASPAAADGLILDGKTPGLAGPQMDAVELSPSAVGVTVSNADERTHVVQAGETLSQIAEQYGMTVGALAALNALANPDRVDVGQSLRVAAGDGTRLFIPAGGELARVQFWPWPAVQGQTLAVWVQATGEVPLAVTLGDTAYPVTQAGDQGWALIPFGPLVAPGVRSLNVRAGDTELTLPVPIRAGQFDSYDVPASVTGPILGQTARVNTELEKVTAMFATESAPGWSPRSRFANPLDGEYAHSDHFGSRRTYGGGGAVSAHAGEDFSAPPGTVVYAPAAGTVLLAEPLLVRGNAVILDHGNGVVTGYWHMQKLDVEAGQHVEAGQALGEVGSTGLSTGAHLHWEFRVRGAAADPMQWLEP